MKCKCCVATGKQIRTRGVITSPLCQKKRGKKRIIFVVTAENHNIGFESSTNNRNKQQNQTKEIINATL